MKPKIDTLLLKQTPLVDLPILLKRVIEKCDKLSESYYRIAMYGKRGEDFYDMGEEIEYLKFIEEIIESEIDSRIDKIFKP